ncbi:hypothetical protein EDD18DRAFT_1101023 [Armillaria luteobubalina]|uniref:Uncharacterized protein n=1 Tax=Armillaria luteobubalina TaxID=153913 RepID=A0AA39QE13_9AGAR|nr:hypothetical protein EDD18DRAFT_1101023 [Armillaria luteobubalina]
MTYFARHGSRYIKPSRATAMGPSPGCKTGKLDLLATSADTAQVTERKMCAMRALNNQFAFTSGKPVWLGNVGVKPRKATVPLLSPGYGMFLLSGFLWPVGGRSDTQGMTRRRDVGFQGITAADAQGVIHSQNVGIVCTPYRAGLISHRAVPRRRQKSGLEYRVEVRVQEVAELGNNAYRHHPSRSGSGYPIRVIQNASIMNAVSACTSNSAILTRRLSVPSSGTYRTPGFKVSLLNLAFWPSCPCSFHFYADALQHFSVGETFGLRKLRKADKNNIPPLWTRRKGCCAQ